MNRQTRGARTPRQAARDTDAQKSEPPAPDSCNRGGAGGRLPHPWVVLVIATLLPGAGQVLNRMPGRALTMVFFMLTLGFVTYQLAPPDRSFVGRHAGGVFVYAVAIMDAYYYARYHWTLARQRARERAQTSSPLRLIDK
jgi:hypothetical protein